MHSSNPILDNSLITPTHNLLLTVDSSSRHVDQTSGRLLCSQLAEAQLFRVAKRGAQRQPAGTSFVFVIIVCG